MKINARNCKIKRVSQDDYINFTKENHKQKCAASDLIYGLYYNDELIQIMSFGKPRFNKMYQWEIIRDCTKKDIEVNGGTSRLWKHFIKNNVVKSCICYSYPHDGEFTSKYVDYCGFINIRRAKPQKKIYFEGIWNGELKRIDKSILERHGADRLLKGNFGHDRNNEQILIDLGFEKKYEDGYEPQVDYYFPCGILYKITDINSNKFYIGVTTDKEKWDNGYLGSGHDWNKYLEENRYHNYEREISKDDFNTPAELYEAEVNEIRKYCIQLDNGNYVVDKNTGCMNVKTSMQNTNPVCPECGAANFVHKKTCSMYKEAKPCPECGVIRGHKRSCSRAKKCPECGQTHGKHLNTCSLLKPRKTCKECGLSNGRHKKTCSHFKEVKICEECGGICGEHKKTCSHVKKCPKCGTIKGHKKTCSRYKERVCPECGVNSGHLKTCSHYVDVEACPECGTKYGHKKTCSKYVAPAPCPECGKTYGHKRGCSKFNEVICEECGSRHGHHKKTCSHYKLKNTCEECGGLNGNHFSTCSKFTKVAKCEECGGGYGHHKKTCSKYKAPNIKRCPHCGTPPGGKHKKGCPDYVEILPCPECGLKIRHKEWCSKNKKNRKGN